MLTAPPPSGLSGCSSPRIRTIVIQMTLTAVIFILVSLSDCQVIQGMDACICLFLHRPIWSSLSEPPAVIVYSNNVSSDTGSLVIISCTVFAIPLPNITWTVTNQYGSTHIVENTSTTIITTSALTVQNYTYATSYLVICNTTENDTGTYTCSGSNQVNGSSLTVTSEEFGVAIRGTMFVCSSFSGSLKVKLSA